MSDLKFAVYLGDGVYAKFADGMVELTVHNGLESPKSIFLEIGVFIALKDFGNRSFGLL